MNTKSILYNLFAVSMLLGGASLLGACTDTMQINEEGDRNNITGTAAGKLTLRFGDGTRAGEDSAGSEGSTDITEDAVENEKKINKLYLALFQDNRLYSMYKYPGEETSGTSKFSTTITGVVNSDGIVTSYEVEKPGYTGSYEAYVIANPSAAVETDLEKMKGFSNTTDEASIATKDAFLNLYMTGSDDKTPANDDEKAYNEARGFTMVSDPTTIDLRTSGTSANITLTRIAARFDFVIWTAGEDAASDVIVSSVTLKNAAQRSYLFPKSEIKETSEDWIAQNSQSYSTAGSNLNFEKWNDLPNTEKATFYTYENLNNNLGYTSIELKYTLNGAEKTLPILLTDNKGNNLPVTRNHLYRIYLNCVTAQFTIEVLDWNASEDYVQIHNKDLAINYTADDLGKTGDFVYSDSEGNLYFSDGGLRKLYIDGSTDYDDEDVNIVNKAGYDIIGVVMSHFPSDTDQKAGYNGGYFIILNNFIATDKDENGKAAQIGWRKSDNYPINGDDQVFKWPLLDGDDNNALRSDLDGRAHTELIINDNDELAVNPQLKLFKQWNDSKDQKYKLKRTSETNEILASDWFIPTIGQWIEAVRLMEKGIMTSFINNTGSTICNPGESTSRIYKQFEKANVKFGRFNGYMTCTGCKLKNDNYIRKLRFVSDHGKFYIHKHGLSYSENGILPFAAFSKKAVKPIPAN